MPDPVQTPEDGPKPDVSTAHSTFAPDVTPFLSRLLAFHTAQERDKKRRSSFSKMTSIMGDESSDAADIVASSMHADSPVPAKSPSVRKAMEKSGVAKIETDKKGSSCCVIA